MIAIDIDMKKIEMGQNNAEVYRVADKIEYVCDSFFRLAPTLKEIFSFYLLHGEDPDMKGVGISNLT